MEENNTPPLSCVVMGSFKYKSKIDKVIKELKNLGAKVRAPEEGGLYKYNPELTGQLIDIDAGKLDFFPLLSERQLKIGQIENDFLNKIRISDFVYIVNPDGYMGETVSMELGFCFGMMNQHQNLRIYSMFALDPNLDPDPLWRERISLINKETPENTYKLEMERKAQGPEILVPNPEETELLLGMIYKER